MVPFAKEDVKTGIQSIHGSKISGLDDYKNFSKCMEYIGEEVATIILNFFKDGNMLKQLNFIAITLVPKVELPRIPTDDKHISFCNALDKCFTKMIIKHVETELFLSNMIMEAFVMIKMRLKETTAHIFIVSLTCTTKWSILELRRHILEEQQKKLILCFTKKNVKAEDGRSIHGLKIPKSDDYGIDFSGCMKCD
ncbi:LOW QUALITY PROTEIN: hypothetical protein Cgig2_024970 [Carnegiea gigantea]|uniref:Uncharacterized protein n=1 Tax=Carnegiea gigantea TaxID=171969 RepID=A0A9Q1JQ29_9CARY|nr:LOW QUALITY PROTEIN: hypothetical protein Cgig2_024970 [Carnegiea gigantea]